MPALPVNHVQDALKLEGADARIHLFELSPIAGGTIYFKADDPIEWQGNTYEGLPCAVTGEEYSTEKTPMPRLTIGQDNVDLLPFKGLVHDGYLDGASLTRRIVLLDDLVNDRDIKITTNYRIKRVESYSRSQISCVLASFSGALNQTLPFRQYIPPAFPWVDI